MAVDDDGDSLYLLGWRWRERAAELGGRFEALGYVVPSAGERTGAGVGDPKDLEKYSQLAFHSTYLTSIGAWADAEKTRLVMARMLYDPPNFLVLDEPTNHLDIGTKQMLIEALADFEGTMLFVSHDRHFLAALSNRTLELTPEGAHRYDGGYLEYVARSGHEAPGLRD